MFALIAILFWSGSDLFSKLGSRPDDPYSHWKMVMAVGTVMGLHAFYMMATGTPFEMMDIVRYLPASLLYIFSMILGYAGLRYIELSISSPICNASGALVQIEITEQTPPQLTRTYHTPASLASKYSVYGIYRYTGTVPEAPSSSSSGKTSFGVQVSAKLKNWVFNADYYKLKYD